MVNGIFIGFLEILTWGLFSYGLRKRFPNLQDINCISYYWFMITILTFVWEYSYISDYNEISQYANQLIEKEEHVWTNHYDLSYVLPWKLSKIFYTEYAAHADREYMSDKNIWSRIIEGSHEWCCGLFALIALISKYYLNHNLYLIAISVSMGTQFMNSLLYMINYFIQVKDPTNPNYNSSEFPLGFALKYRAFFWVNLCWLVFPFVILTNLIIHNV